MTSPPLGNTHDRTMSGVACHHSLWTANTIERRQAWNDITTIGQHIRSNDVGRERPSLPLDGTLGRMTSGVACRHRLRAVHTVKRRGAWHVVIAFGQHTRSNDVWRGMPSSPLGRTNGRTTSGVACHLAFRKHKRSNDVGRGMTSPPLDGTHNQTTSGVA